jgi:hypothetical protein
MVFTESAISPVNGGTKPKESYQTPKSGVENPNQCYNNFRSRNLVKYKILVAHLRCENLISAPFKTSYSQVAQGFDLRKAWLFCIKII